MSDRSETGSLYLEMLIALSVLAFSLLAILPMFITAARNNAASTDLTMAATLAQDKAEELRATSYEALVPGTEEEIVTWEYLRYKRTWVVEADLPHPGMTRVTVTVEPLHLDGQALSRKAELSYHRAP